MSRNIAVSAGFIVACAGALMCSPADAAPLGAAQGVRAAAESVSLVENAACWRFGWHGWGWVSLLRSAARHDRARLGLGARLCERRGFETVVRYERRCD
jgi:hypothetical protein